MDIMQDVCLQNVKKCHLNAKIDDLHAILDIFAVNLQKNNDKHLALMQDYVQMYLCMEFCMRFA